MNRYKEFTAEDTTVIKGVGIILMIIHHLHIDPQRMNSNMQIISLVKLGRGETLSHYVGRFAIICIPLYLFLSGFGLMTKFESLDSEGLQIGLFNRVRKIFFSYWKVFIIVVPISFLFFSKQSIVENEYYYSRFCNFSISNTIGAFIGLTPEKICGEWWFLRIHLSSLFMFPLFRNVIKKKSFWQSLWLIILIDVFLSSVYHAIPTIGFLDGLSNDYFFNNLFYGRQSYFAAFLMGMLMGHNGNIMKISNEISKNRVANMNMCYILLLLACIIVRNDIVGGESDIIIVPIIVMSIRKTALSCDFVYRCLHALGSHSTTMWLIHTFIIYYWGVFQRLILAPRYSLLVSIWAILIVFIISVAIDMIYKRIQKCLVTIKVMNKDLIS